MMKYIKTLDFEVYSTRMWADNLRAIDDIYNQFEALGVPTVGSSRIRAYRDVLISLDEAKNHRRQFTQSLAEKALHTFAEFGQLQTILKAARISTQQGVWQSQLRKLVSGPGFPRPESKHSAARDFQFECFVAAVSELSGYSIRFNEPDVLVERDNHLFGIAVKRITSPRKIESNCRKGVRQILKSGFPGIIALDISYALYPHQCINTNDLQGALRFVEGATNTFIATYHKRLEAMCREPHVLGVLAHLQLPVLNFGHAEGPQLASAIRWTIDPFCSQKDQPLRWILQFAQDCQSRLLG
jgi:hypothetical protein